MDLFEIDEDDVRIMIFSISLESKVKIWFKNLPIASISNFQQLSKIFVDKWIIKVNRFIII